ncbi:MAG: hypothetical protein JW841_17370 [Deltaproteobacteria bacterium]|nr:hypothetical protein [Deltaproteobacteria bacterium]
MSAIFEVVNVAASLFLALAATPLVDAGEDTMKALVVESNISEPDLALFIRERITATWPNKQDFLGHSFIIEIIAVNADFVKVVISDKGQLWAERNFALLKNDNENVELRLAVWLFVRSTISRLLVEGNRGQNKTDNNSNSPKLKKESDKAPKIFSNNDEKKVIDGIAVFVISKIATRGWSNYGLGFAIDKRWHQNFISWAETGFATAQVNNSLNLHQVFANLAFAINFDQVQDFAIGINSGATLELVNSSKRNLWVGGAELGPVCRWQISLSVKQSIFLHAAFMWNLVRQRYLLTNSTVQKAPYSAQLAAGVVWP